MSKTADVLMQEAVNTYQERNRVYGSSYHKHGEVMAALFPKGITLTTAHEFNLFGIYNMIVSKLCRLSQSREHQDSIHDIGVYSFMYEELLDLRAEMMDKVNQMADLLIPFDINPGFEDVVPTVLDPEEMKVRAAAGQITLRPFQARQHGYNPIDDVHTLKAQIEVLRSERGA